MITLTANVGPNDRRIRVSEVVAPPTRPFAIDSELLVFVGYGHTLGVRNPRIWRVGRAYAGTARAAHLAGAEVRSTADAYASGIFPEPPSPFVTGGEALAFELIPLDVDLSTAPNTEDNAVVEQSGVTIEGPAWVEGRLIVSDLVKPVAADTVSISAWALGEAWVSGESDAVLLVGRTSASSSSVNGGIVSASVGNDRFFVPADVTARVGLRVQPSDNEANPVAGQCTGTLRIAIIIGRFGS